MIQKLEITSGLAKAPASERQRSFVLSVVQPGLAGLMDGSISSLERSLFYLGLYPTLIGSQTLNKMWSQIGDGSHDNQHALAYYEYRTSFQGSQECSVKLLKNQGV